MKVKLNLKYLHLGTCFQTTKSKKIPTVSREEKETTYKGIQIKEASDFSSTTLDVNRKCSNAFGAGWGVCDFFNLEFKVNYQTKTRAKYIFTQVRTQKGYPPIVGKLSDVLQ